jgi:hypothetical protein
VYDGQAVSNCVYEVVGGGGVGEGMTWLQVCRGTCPKSESIREHFNMFVTTLQKPDDTIYDQYISYCQHFSVQIKFGHAVFVESDDAYDTFVEVCGTARRARLKRDYGYTMPLFKREAALRGYYHNQLHQCYWLASLPEETCTEHVAALLNYQAAWGDAFAKHADAIETILRSTPVRIESGTILYRYNDIDIENTTVYARYAEALRTEPKEPLVIESVTSTSYYDRAVLNRILSGNIGQKEFGAILTATTPIPCAVFPLNTLQFEEMEAVLPKKLIVHVNAQNVNTRDSTKVEAPIYECDISYEKVPPVAVTYVTVIPHVATT